MLHGVSNTIGSSFTNSIRLFSVAKYPVLWQTTYSPGPLVGRLILIGPSLDAILSSANFFMILSDRYLVISFDVALYKQAIFSIQHQSPLCNHSNYAVLLVYISSTMNNEERYRDCIMKTWTSFSTLWAS